jgi:hypothetical protein
VSVGSHEDKRREGLTQGLERRGVEGRVRKGRERDGGRMGRSCVLRIGYESQRKTSRLPTDIPIRRGQAKDKVGG